MQTFTFSKTTTEAQRDSVVLSLRKAGFSASRETHTFRTDASITAIGLTYGDTTVVVLK
jgi:tRNA G26 N,N-dimethylase Trm1